MLVGFSRTARHNRGSPEGTFFAARNADAHKVHTFFCKRSFTANSIGEMRVTAVNNNVPLIKKRS